MIYLQLKTKYLPLLDRYNDGPRDGVDLPAEVTNVIFARSSHPLQHFAGRKRKV